MIIGRDHLFREALLISVTRCHRFVVHRLPAEAGEAAATYQSLRSGMVDNENYRLLYKIAKAYYDDQLTQQEIGERFGLSRVKINRLLSKAREQKIVQIQVVPPESSDTELEREIEERCGLKEVILVPSADSHESLLRNLGEGAATYLKRILTGKEVVSITWGTSLFAMVEALSPINTPDIRVVQMLGGLGDPDADVHGAEIVHRLAQLLQAKPRILFSPGIVGSVEVRKALYADVQVADTLRLAAQADIALVGIGTLGRHSLLVRAGTVLSSADIKRLQVRKVAGDIALRFFDINGKPLEDELNERIIGLTLEEIHKIPRVVAVAGGTEKYDAICGALRGRYIDVLVTDHPTAGRLAKEDL